MRSGGRVGDDSEKYLDHEPDSKSHPRIVGTAHLLARDAMYGPHFSKLPALNVLLKM